MIAHWLQWQWSNEILSEIPFVNGVLFFFVLSGFLITRILLVQRDSNIENNSSQGKLYASFVIRRMIRIIPIYYLVIIVALIINLGAVREIYPWLLTYTTNIYQSISNEHLSVFNHLWSLAVEEQFYLIWPILIIAFKPKYTLTIILCAILVSFGHRNYLYATEANWMSLSYSTLSVSFSLAFGALVAFWSVYKPKIIEYLSKPLWILLLGLYMIVLFFLQYKFQLSWYDKVFAEIVFAVMASLIIIKAYQGTFSSVFKIILEHKWIIYLGKISYGLYLYHLFVPDLIEFIWPDVIAFNHDYSFGKYILFLINLLITIIASHVSWKIIESPLNKLKSRFQYQ